jgi:hypothetical protein
MFIGRKASARGARDVTLVRGLRTLALATLLLATACGGGEAPDDGVASLEEGGGTASEAAGTEAARSDEEQMLEWAQCMRDEGVDIPDPEVDAEGNMQLQVLAGGSGGGDGRRIAPEDIEAAQEVCGEPPMISNLSPERRAEFEDAALEFAQCMRDRGHDVPDPDFSGGEGRVRFGGRNIDPDDPEMQADAQECQEESFGQPRGGPGGAVSGGGGATGNGS